MQNRLRSTLLCLSLFTALTIPAQQAPHAVSIVRNDSTTDLTIEYLVKGTWNSVKLEHGKDTPLPAAEHIRVATVRDDKATITVDLPVAPAGKYRLLWNTQAGMWDFSTAAGSGAPQ
jgi:hypothetical protein